MSIARAFTTRRGKQPMDLKEPNSPQRINTTSRGHSGSLRSKISSPMELTHTTNMLAYNAPDLYPLSARSVSSSASKSTSDDESDARTNASSPPTSPDIASVKERSNFSTVEPNHLSSYFTAPGQSLPSGMNEVPSIPKRAPSHTKKASFDNLAQKQAARYSNQSLKTASSNASFTLSRSSSTSTTATSVSTNSHNNRSKPVIGSPTTPAMTAPTPARRRSLRNYEMSPPANHPFGHELAQVSEIAEDYGVSDKLDVVREEQKELAYKGLCSLKAEDYAAEVQKLFTTFFMQEPYLPQESYRPQEVWI